MKSGLEKALYGIAALVTFILFFLLLNGIIQPAGQVLQDGWRLTGAEDIRQVDLPYRKVIDSLTTLVFSRDIQYEYGDALILTRPNGQALQVRLDGIVIFTVGDPQEPTANLWNTTFYVQLPDHDAQSAELEILLTSASFPIGMSIPPYIQDSQSAQGRVALIDFVYNDCLLIAIGASFLIGVILILLSLMQKRGWSTEVLLGAAIILAALESFDYVYCISHGNLAIYFAIKKVLMSAGYLSAFLFLAGMERYGQKKLHVTKFMAIPTALTVLLILALPKLTDLYNLISVLNVVLLLDLVIAIVYIFKNSKSKRWMVFLAVWLILGLLQMLAVIFLEFPGPYVMQAIILLGTGIFGLNLLLDFNRVYLEKMDLEKRIVLDTLTTAYNRNILGETSQELYDVLMLMDLDNFKAYNDRHGHQQGDQLLIQFTEIIKNNIRQGDLVVRYGGDEFLVLLTEIGIIDAEQVALRIRYDLEAATPGENLSVSYGIEKMEHSLDSDLVKADRLMYAMKQSKQVRAKNN